MKILKKYYTESGCYQGINILSFKILNFQHQYTKCVTHLNIFISYFFLISCKYIFGYNYDKYIF